jgi:copper chaperone CopZ
MSRRRGEFEHRTSIFEGAFRAWSHLGGLLPEDLENKSTTDLDPLNFPLENDPRLGNKKGTIVYPDGTTRREYPYEPLPRSGLAHPYVQAILSPWLGPDADNEAIQLGLTTLRTWWQHRRKGESGSATAALGTEKMKGVVEGYTRHFFTLAHCLVMNDREQPPRTLHSKMKDLEKLRSKRNKKRAREEEAGKLVASALSTASPVPEAVVAPAFDDGTSAGIRSDLMDSNLSPLERLHAAQRRQLAESGGIHAVIPVSGSEMAANDMTATPLIHIKGKCMPGKVNLPEILDQVNHHATQLAHRGDRHGDVPMAISSSDANANRNGQELRPEDQQQQRAPKYGDPNMTPVVFVSGNGDIQVSMAVNGITCAHCVKIVETVLKGCNGNKSPIDGLLDAAADRVLNSVLIKIDKAGSAKRIAFESARNLAMVGYTAKIKEMSIVGHGADEKATLDLGALSTAFEVIANTDSEDVFDWTIACTCPDNGVLRDDCAR